MSDKVKRYLIQHNYDLGYNFMVQNKTGDYVKHTAYANLEAENARLKTMLAEVVNSGALQEALEINK